MSEVFREVIRTWCPQKRQVVELTLEGCKSQGCLGCLVQGHPLDCSESCEVRTPLCLLKADSVTTARKKEAS
jgi:hypothetical protein